MIVLIKDLRHPNTCNTIRVPEKMEPGEVVELWQKKSLYFQLHGTPPPITWKVAESNDYIKAMIEGGKL